MELSLSMNEIIQLLVEQQQFVSLVQSQITELEIGNKNREFKIKSLSFNSKEKGEKILFFCKGAGFKAEYLEEAIENGAVSYLIDEILAKKDSFQVTIPGILVKNSQKAMAVVAMHFYRYPQKKLRIIGITGTKGKTTTAVLLKSVLDQQNGGKTAIFSTSYTEVGSGFVSSSLTTPESLDLYCLMHQAVEAGYTDLVMEVSSQAYLMNRVYDLDYDLGIFLNIFPDHIGANEHHSFADYLSYKLKLFEHCKSVVIHTETLALKEIKAAAEKYTEKIIWTGASKSDVHYQLLDYQDGNQLTSFQVLERRTLAAPATQIQTSFFINLLGSVNAENALVVIAAASQLNCSLEQIKAGLIQAVISGRMEIVPFPTCQVIVDYAHNGISLERLLLWAKSRYPFGRKIVIFGCPGGKGLSRRQDLGRVVASLADFVILTEDDSNFENPLDICQEISRYLVGRVPFVIQSNRQEAIRQGLAMAKSQDVVLVVGKGNEAFQKRLGAKVPYATDRRVIEELSSLFL